MEATTFPKPPILHPKAANNINPVAPPPNITVGAPSTSPFAQPKIEAAASTIPISYQPLTPFHTEQKRRLGLKREKGKGREEEEGEKGKKGKKGKKKGRER